MSIISRWKAPTPAFFKKVIRISLTLAAGAAAALMVEPIGSAAISGFTFKLHPIMELICKNLVACGIVAAAIAKFAKEGGNDDNIPPYSAPKDDSIK